MAIKYTAQQRQQIIDEANGKTIKTLEWSSDEDGSNGYWVMTFTDDSEISFRLMAELC